MDWLGFFWGTVFALALVLAIIYCLEIAFGCLPLRRRDWNRWREVRPRVDVLIPAHNEATGIRATIESVRPQLHAGDRIIVIADNCTDNTVEVARELGATVHIRTDQQHRGKGFALAYGLNQLRVFPPEVVAFIDADCRLGAGTLDALAYAAVHEERPVQALNLCVPPAGSGTKHCLSGLAFRFKNLVRMSGMCQLGQVCHLTGTGMAIPWNLIDVVKWASGNVVEDMQLGIDYTVAGYAPRFVPEARILSELPPTEQGLLQQRRRWEHGFLGTAFKQVPYMLRLALLRGSWPLLILAIDMLVPPLALLSLILTGIWLAALVAWMAGYQAPLLFTTIVNTTYCVFTFLGWYVHCRDVVPVKTFWQVPSYILAKVPLYWEFITRRQQTWERAQRS
jgi:cellulose synthase/poly-beta-1,6-N-acetylglucosamine synthase-like glycosyltransferase